MIRPIPRKHRRLTSEQLESRDLLAADPIISEFMASNQGSLRDGDGNSSDWIEIHNRGNESIDLQGWHLTDKADNLQKWELPSTVLEPDDYFVLFASGQDTDDYVDGDGNVHTNFKLSADGEYLAIVNPDGVVAHSYGQEFPPQFSDISFGLDSNGSQRYFAEATPGSANGVGVQGFVEDLSINLERGIYDAPIDVTIATPTPGATVRYTIDGSAPSATNGIDYAGPIRIDGTTTLRASAFRDDYLPAAPITHSYIYLADVLAQPSSPDGFPDEWGKYFIGNKAGRPMKADYEMRPSLVTEYADTLEQDLKSIPTLSIVMDQDDLFGAENGIYPNPFIDKSIREKATSIEWIDPAGSSWQEDAGIRMFGGWSRHFDATPKKSFALKFKSEYGVSKLEQPIFANDQVDSKIPSTAEFDTVLLRAVFSDAWPDAASQPTYLRDLNARYAQLAMGQPSSHGTWVHLYLNGLYWGIYNPSERPDASFAAAYGGGNKDEYDAVKHRGLNGPGQASNDQFEVVDGGDEAKDGFQAALDLAARGLEDQDNYEEFKSMVDVENLADYILLEHYIGNIDWPHKNWYANRKREGGDGWKFYVWDSEYTLRNTSETRIDSNNARTPGFLWAAARENKEFRQMFADRVQKHLFNDGALQPEKTIARFQALADQIDGAIKAEAARWGDHSQTRQGSTNYDHADWLQFIRRVDRTLSRRHDTALEQLVSRDLYPELAAPEFSQFGGTTSALSMTTATGSIFYTTDGTEPRGEAIRTSLIGSEVPVTATVPTDDSLGKTWTLPEFDDSQWLAGNSGVGYERRSGYENLIGIDLLSDEIAAGLRIDTNGDGDNENNSVYVRVPFELSEAPTDFDFLTLKMQTDDGFAAYLNGVQLTASHNAPTTLEWNSAATSTNRDTLAKQFVSFDISSQIDLLKVGRNVLAIHAMNRTLDSDDMLIAPKLEVGKTAAGISGTKYVDPISITAETVVKARTFDGVQWSALTEAVFSTEKRYTFADFLILSTNFGKTNATEADGDLDGDTEVSFADFLILSANFGAE